MRDYFIGDVNFDCFVESLVEARRVIAPVARKSRFVFERLESAAELRLDYDTTLLPPKKAIMPVDQDLVRFERGKAESALAPTAQVLFGVHPHDVKALDMLDELFASGHCDNNWVAYREATTVVASNVQRVSGRAFFDSVATTVVPKGHDAFLTKIADGYHFSVFTPKGEALLALGAFASASDAQTEAARAIHAPSNRHCPEALEHASDEIASKVRASFANEELWKELSALCFSCGSCNIVCPTCYCFDVQDTWNLDQTSGRRCRSWDGCMLAEFAQVSLVGGHTENFREQPFQRFRHRIMRKATYLNTKLGGPACVGCGRCSEACVPDIADPVRIITKIMEG